jgi:hypothetical protein
VLDETALFDHLGADVYADVTAHFLEKGNEMMVAEVAKWLASRPAPLSGTP